MARRSLRCLFRIAAGPRLGFGHLLRARSLARALRLRPVVSVRGGGAVWGTARRLGCRTEQRGLAEMSVRDYDVWVVDDPSPDEADRWLARARRLGVPSVAIQDVGRNRHGADLVVDGRIHPSPTLDRHAALAGPRFCILDPKLATLRRQSTERPRPSVLVALGGGSHVHRLAGALVGEISRRCPRAAITVAPGFCGRPDRVRLPAGRWMTNARRFATALAQCDVAVLAGGVTLYEACALGVPAVAMAVVPAQRPSVAAFSAHGATIDAGSADDRAAARVAGEAVARLLVDRAARERASAAGRQLVDGFGAERVAAHIRAIARGKAA